MAVSIVHTICRLAAEAKCIRMFTMQDIANSHAGRKHGFQSPSEEEEFHAR